MRDAEQAIDKVLAGLRDADIPQGLEGRILRTIEERGTARDLQGRWRVSITMPGYARLVAGGVVGGVLLVMLNMPSMHQGMPAAVNGRNTSVTTASERHAGRPANDVPRRLKPQVQGGSYGTAKAVPLSNVLRSGMEGPSVIAYATREAADSAEPLPTDPNALAMSEMLAPSKPAPPLPLTHQERLLAQVVHKGEPDAIANLRPDLRAKQMEVGKAEFQNFFNPPPVNDNE